ncbi:hypothetical protein [Streptomyces lydicamycinicus]|uniref:hypothetical protein n=1 Tax=Streptomyces lydicamycinicus TaxID=1546107 RepID=UPI000AD5341B|nr:hypothetical protein [Streptomyces lydicamycinicus]
MTVLVTARALTAYVPPDLHTSRAPLGSELHYALLVAHTVTTTVAVLTGLARSRPWPWPWPWPWLRQRATRTAPPRRAQPPARRSATRTPS